MKNIHVSKILGLEILASELSSIHIFFRNRKKNTYKHHRKKTHIINVIEIINSVFHFMSGNCAASILDSKWFSI